LHPGQGIGNGTNAQQSPDHKGRTNKQGLAMLINAIQRKTGIIVRPLLLGLLIWGCYACSEKSPPPQASKTPQEGFTFFELGADSTYSKDMRRELEQKLGSDAISRKIVIDLSLSADREGLLDKHFPSLADLNKRLNWPPKERIEHNTIKLMYRYVSNLPFTRVILLFSGFTHKPLLFRINAKGDVASILESIHQKYGPPTKIQTKNSSNYLLYWKKESDYLMIHITRDIHDQIRHEFMIHFVDNMETLLETELKEGQTQRKERKAAGRKAF
jgi:hypothetical protein